MCSKRVLDPVLYRKCSAGAVHARHAPAVRRVRLLGLRGHLLLERIPDVCGPRARVRPLRQGLHRPRRRLHRLRFRFRLRHP